jgi:flagellar hook assembly protein FlgD
VAEESCLRDSALGFTGNKIQKPSTFHLSQNYPNPFNPSTKIKFTLPKPENVKVEIYNTIGQRVETLINKHLKAGQHTLEFNGQNLSSGIYFYRIEAGEYMDFKKMVLLR